MTIKEQNEIEKLEGQIDSLYADIDKYNIELDNYDNSGEDNPEKENAILDKIDATEEKIDELEKKIDDVSSKEQSMGENKMKLVKQIIKEDYKKLGLKKGDIVYKESSNYSNNILSNLGIKKVSVFSPTNISIEFIGYKNLDIIDGKLIFISEKTKEIIEF